MHARLACLAVVCAVGLVCGVLMQLHWQQHRLHRACVVTPAAAHPLVHQRLGARPVRQQPKHAAAGSSSTASSTSSSTSSSSRLRCAALPSGGEDGPPPTPQQQRPLLLQLLAAAVRAAAGALLLLAVAPYLLSTRPGTAAAAAAASRVLPGCVHIRSMRLGWTAPIAIHGLVIHEGPARSSRQLVGLDCFSSAEPLHAVLTSHAGVTFTLSNPSIDCSLTDSGTTLRLVEFLQASRLWNLIAGKRASAGAGGQTAASASSSSSSGKAVGASHPIELTDAEEAAAGAADAGDGGQGPPAAAAAGPSSSSRPAVFPPAAAAAAGAAPPQTQPAAGAAAGALPAQPTGLLQRLTQADAVSHVSAELRLPRVSLFIPDGKLLLPEELRAAMGDHIHAVAAAGGQAVRELAEELDDDCSWLAAQQQQQQQSMQQAPSGEEGAGSGSNSKQQQGKEEQPEQVEQHWPLPPEGLSASTWARATPLLLQVSGDRVAALVRGWHLGSWWRLSQSSLLLQQPATAAWTFTPELAALTLPQFNPLLEEVAFIREGGQLTTSIAPEGGRIPAHSGELLVSPLKLVVGKGSLLSQIHRLLGLRFGGSGSSSKPWAAPGGADTSKGDSSAAAAAGAAGADDGSSVKGLEVWSGPLRVTMEAPGRFKTHRVDMLLGSGRGSLHVALWGTVDAGTNRLAMTIGLPASTLSKAGIGGLPSSYMLPVAVAGPLHKPQIEWNAAVRQLAVLSAMQLGREAAVGAWQREEQQAVGAAWGALTHQQAPPGLGAGLSGLLGAANRALSSAASRVIGQVDQRMQAELCEVPPPASNLPWEQQQQHGKRHGVHR